MENVTEIAMHNASESTSFKLEAGGVSGGMSETERADLL